MAATSIHPIHTTEIKSIRHVKPIMDIIDFVKFKAKGLQRWVDIQNMKNVANMINLLKEYNIKSTSELKPTASVVLAERAMLSSTIDKKIDGLSDHIALVRTFQRTTPFYDEYKSLPPRKQKKFLETNAPEIKQFHETGKALKSLYPDGRFPSLYFVYNGGIRLTSFTDSGNNLMKNIRNAVQTASNNINQIARRMNVTSLVYMDDVSENLMLINSASYILKLL